jgi:hypothetical protein
MRRPGIVRTKAVGISGMVGVTKVSLGEGGTIRLPDVASVSYFVSKLV